MGGGLHNIPLVHDDILLLILDDDFLINDLHRIELPILFEPAQKDL